MIHGLDNGTILPRDAEALHAAILSQVRINAPGYYQGEYFVTVRLETGATVILRLPGKCLDDASGKECYCWRQAIYENRGGLTLRRGAM